MFSIVITVSLAIMAQAGPATEMAAYKGQFCTDPRTMRKHAAYTEWADAYSCTRHRCQPGGRNLAIYTVGCKRVEAPESAIECEEVVEDTNMQFPYCCTRLRCLVVVRGEVWTRVLGQPWETLPAAPWSHMYKMKKPPPTDGTFSPKTEEGPVYELQMADNEREAPPTDAQVLRTGKKIDTPECNDAVSRTAPAPAPDIVIALSTGSDKETLESTIKKEEPRHKRRGQPSSFFDEGDLAEPRNEEIDEIVTEKEKIVEPEPQSEERPYVPQKPNKPAQHHMVSWTEIPQNQWNEREPAVENDQPQNNMGPNQRSQWNDHELEAPRQAPDVQARVSPPAQTWEHQSNAQPEYNSPPEEKKEEKPGNLQALVDAIGTRMRDIETVVARMSEKVHQDRNKIDPEFGNADQNQQQYRSNDDQKYHEGKEKDYGVKKPNPDGNYNSRGSKYLHASVADVTTEQPLFVEDTNLNGYFSDASNSLTRRNGPKEPAATYMAPVVETRRKVHSDSSDESEKKHKKRIHKKKHAKGHHKKHHGKDDKRRKFRLNSVEQDRNAVSLEDSSAVVSKETIQKKGTEQNNTTDPFTEYGNPFAHQKEYVLKSR